MCFSKKKWKYVDTKRLLDLKFFFNDTENKQSNNAPSEPQANETSAANSSNVSTYHQVDTTVKKDSKYNNNYLQWLNYTAFYVIT